MPVSVNQILANTLGLADPLGRIADDGRVGFNGRVNINGRPIRFAPNFDSVDDYGVLANRAINPDGDIDIEFYAPTNSGALGTDRAIISQSISTTFSAREFGIVIAGTGNLVVNIGGVITTLLSVSEFLQGDLIRVFISGSTFSVFKNGTIFRASSITKGAAREPTAQTVICARNNNGTIGNYSQGPQYNIKVNGVLWRMADRNQAIQLPEPSGLGAELITPTVLENPFSKGSQWTYLGAGRWQYIGDGSQNDLIFIGLANMPANGCLVELEVESYSGAGTARFSSNSSVVNSTFTGTGIKRAYVTSQAVFNIGRQTGALSMIIKNISFKPLAVVNATELVTNGDFSAGTTGWTTTTGTLSVSNGQATLTTEAAQNSRFERNVTLEAGAYHEVRCDLISLSGVTRAVLSLRRGSAGSFVVISDISITQAGRASFIVLAPATDAIIQIRGDGANAGTVVVDNISIRKLDSLCNPMTLVNVTSDRWQEVAQ